MLAIEVPNLGVPNFKFPIWDLYFKHWNCYTRYAEKDHQQLVEMRRQRDEVQQKLAKGHQAYVDGEPAENYQEGMSLVLEEGIDF